MNEDINSEPIAAKVISWGSEIIGSGVGAIIGGVVAGPLGVVSGAAAGSATGHAIQMMGDYAHRQLSSRERVRIGAAFGFALSRIQERLSRGDPLRPDDLFTADESGRSAAGEILEGTVQKCRDAFQEQKLKHLAHIYANIAFEESVSAEDGILILELVDRLTYRQICMVALAGRHNEFHVVHFREFTRNPGTSDPSLRWEWQELYNTYWLTTDTDKVPTLTRLGRIMFRLASLDTLPTGDIQRVWDAIQAGLRHHAD